MILVTLGTQFQPFTRLLEAVNKAICDLNLNEEVIVQAGTTKYISDKMKIFNFVPYEQMNKYIEEARIIITHAGTGSVIDPLKKGKIVIACARLSKYGEHVDDHQLELTSIFAEEGYILELKDDEDLKDVLLKANDFKPKEYRSNTDSFIKLLKDEIG